MNRTFSSFSPCTTSNRLGLQQGGEFRLWVEVPLCKPSTTLVREQSRTSSLCGQLGCKAKDGAAMILLQEWKVWH